MLDLFLKFRESGYWYVFILIIVITVPLILSHIKKKSYYRYKRLAKIIIFLPWILIMLLSITILVMFIAWGPTKDWVENYTLILLIIGPIFIFGLIIYALKKEQKDHQEERRHLETTGSDTEEGQK